MYHLRTTIKISIFFMLTLLIKGCKCDFKWPSMQRTLAIPNLQRYLVESFYLIKHEFPFADIKGTVVNRLLLSFTLHGGSLEIMLTVPLKSSSFLPQIHWEIYNSFLRIQFLVLEILLELLELCFLDLKLVQITCQCSWS